MQFLTGLNECVDFAAYFKFCPVVFHDDAVYWLNLFDNMTPEPGKCLKGGILCKHFSLNRP